MTGRRLCADCSSLVKGAQVAGAIGGTEGQVTGNAIAAAGWYRAARSLRRDAEERGVLEGRAENRRRRTKKVPRPTPRDADSES